jgi:hypothetical protein
MVGQQGGVAVKPAVGLAAIAVVAVAMVPAHGAAHADRVNWSAVAKCESSGNWSANTGNGAYGGLQIKESTWLANGGMGNPANATPAQQIRVAKRILAKQGPGAWPTCMSRARDPGVRRVGSVTHFLTYLVDEAERFGR